MHNKVSISFNNVVCMKEFHVCLKEKKSITIVRKEKIKTTVLIILGILK